MAASESIGNERTGPLLTDRNSFIVGSDSTLVSNKDLDYPKLCSQLLLNPRPFDQIKYRDGVTVRMAKSIYYANEVYVVFEIENGSQIDFEINSLDLYKVNGNNRRKSSYQELLLPPIFQFQLPTVVPKGEQVQFVCVYPKFTLGDRERLLVKMEELHGSRNIEVKLKY